MAASLPVLRRASASPSSLGEEPKPLLISRRGHIDDGAGWMGYREQTEHEPMSETVTRPRVQVQVKPERPRLYKVIVLNNDYTPREFVITVLKAEFRMGEEQARRVMLTAHQRGVCVVAVFTRDVAETKATRATEAARRKGYPLQFTTEPEE